MNPAYPEPWGLVLLVLFLVLGTWLALKVHQK